MAGALGLALAGPRVYGGVHGRRRWMGDGRREATPADIRRGARALPRAPDALLIGAASALLAVAHRALSAEQPVEIEMRFEMRGEPSSVVSTSAS